MCGFPIEKNKNHWAGRGCKAFKPPHEIRHAASHMCQHVPTVIPMISDLQAVATRDQMHETSKQVLHHLPNSYTAKENNICSKLAGASKKDAGFLHPKGKEHFKIHLGQGRERERGKRLLR